jgi:hypothetical protein
MTQTPPRPRRRRPPVNQVHICEGWCPATVHRKKGRCRATAGVASPDFLWGWSLLAGGLPAREAGLLNPEKTDRISLLLELRHVDGSRLPRALLTAGPGGGSQGVSGDRRVRCQRWGKREIDPTRKTDAAATGS